MADLSREIAVPDIKLCRCGHDRWYHGNNAYACSRCNCPEYRQIVYVPKKGDHDG
jgi:hypothetical protein